ncbi:MAG: hypothetical protein ACAH59_02710 [Pseudobdellovibrionaceae bacterium]
MKIAALLLICLTFFTFQTSFAVTTEIAFDKDSFMQEGLGLLKSSLENHLKDTGLAGNSECPESGLEIVEKIESKKGTLMNATASVDEIMLSVKPKVDEKQADTSRCGTCQQKNLVSYLASINPVKIRPVVECESMPAQTFVADLKDKEDIKRYTENTLQGTNSEGKQMAKACPSPCSYYVTTAQTPLNNGKTHLTLTVQCGQPRKDSVLTADYDFKGGLVHQWVCSK